MLLTNYCVRNFAAVLSTFLALAALTSAGRAEDWAQFRGPNATGVSTESKSLPSEFSFEDKVLWSTEIGEGIACPIICNGRVFATSMVGEQKFAVFCFDSVSGSEIWRREFDTGPLPDIMPPNTQASSTPCSDGKRVYVYFSTLGLMALDWKSGEQLWTHEIPMPYYLMGWGAAHSPIVYKDLVIFNQDDDLAPLLLAVDAKTGKTLATHKLDSLPQWDSLAAADGKLYLTTKAGEVICLGSK